MQREVQRETTDIRQTDNTQTSDRQQTKLYTARREQRQKVSYRI